MALAKQRSARGCVSDDPRVIAAKAKKHEIASKIDDVEKLVQQEVNRRNAAADLRQMQAEAFVNDLPMPTAIDSTKLSELQASRHMLTLAGELAEKRLLESEQTASKDVWKSVRGEYHEIVRRQYAAVLALIESLRAEDEFIDEIDVGGFRTNMISRVRLLDLRTAEFLLKEQIMDVCYHFHDKFDPSQ